MTTEEEQPIGLIQAVRAYVRPMQREDIAGVVALAADEATAPHWPVAEYARMLDVIAESPGRRGAWVLLSGTNDGQRVPGPAGGRPQAPGSKAASLAPVLLRQRRSGKPGLSGTPVVSARPIIPLIGFAMASHVAGICDLEAVVVHAGWRGRRLGAALVGAAAAWGASLDASRLQLEVRDSNAAALRLYQRMGFAIDGRRPGYYRNPDEEAVLMSLALRPSGAGEPG